MSYRKLRFSVAAAAAAFAVSAVVAPGTAQAIVGGNTASTSDHPWMLSFEQIAQLSGDTVPAWHHMCGATLVGPNKALTAAHCVQGLKPDEGRVVKGRDDTAASDGWKVKLDSIWYDPKFDGDTAHGHDVAVLTLRDSLSGPYLPIASSEDRDLYTPGQEATILGWGTVRSGGPLSGHLRTAQVSVYSAESCASNYPKHDELPGQFCAGYPEGGVDTCQADSGGPLVVDRKVAGVVSWGSKCAGAGAAGVYSDVSAYSSSLRHQIG